MFFLYRLITDLAEWPLRLVLRIRAWRGKEEPSRLPERRGITAAARPNGVLIWCHAASVGESITFLPMIDRLSKHATVLMTTGTVSSARLMMERLPEHVIHQFAPWDRRAWIAKFLNHWQPHMALRMESEIWPNTLSTLRDGDVSIAIVNGRLSGKSTEGWSRYPQFAKQVFGCLSLVIAQTDKHAERFQRLGARQVEVAGNVKLASPPLPVDQKTLSELKVALTGRPVWLAASTHQGEEEIVLQVHKQIARRIPNVLTVIVPRHAHRGGSIATLARSQDLLCQLRSEGGLISADTNVYIADTFGEMGTWLSICPVVFMGKSLTVRGGQNPIEPIHFGCAVVFGPHMENFKDLAFRMTSMGIAKQANDETDLAHHVETLLADPTTRESIATAAHKFLDSGQESLEKTLSALSTLLDETKAKSLDGNGR